MNFFSVTLPFFVPTGSGTWECPLVCSPDALYDAVMVLLKYTGEDSWGREGAASEERTVNWVVIVLLIHLRKLHSFCPFV